MRKNANLEGRHLKCSEQEVLFGQHLLIDRGAQHTVLQRF